MSDTNTGYNGYSNYETWNIALWLGNDEGLYNYAKEYRHRGYRHLANSLLEFSPTSPDGVSWLDSELDIDQLDEVLKEL